MVLLIFCNQGMDLIHLNIFLAPVNITFSPHTAKILEILFHQLQKLLPECSLEVTGTDWPTSILGCISSVEFMCFINLCAVLWHQWSYVLYSSDS